MRVGLATSCYLSVNTFFIVTALSWEQELTNIATEEQTASLYKNDEILKTNSFKANFMRIACGHNRIHGPGHYRQ